jgi:DNA-binding XRE family transcriptional regulator
MTLVRWETNGVEPKPYLIPRIIDFLGYVPWKAPDGFGAWLRQVRRALGLSRRRLAALLGVDESTITRWESGGGRLSYRLKVRLRFVLMST